MLLRRAPFPLLVTAFGILGSVLPAIGQSTSNQDEARLRQLYQQITYLTQETTVTDTSVAATGGREQQPTSKTLEAKITLQQATFELGSFQQGTIADIRNDLWTNFVTPDFKLTQILGFVPGLQTLTEGVSSPVEWFVARARWRQPNLSNLDLAGVLFSTTVGTMMDQGSRQFITLDLVYTRYLAYTITASFDGQTIGPTKPWFCLGRIARAKA